MLRWGKYSCMKTNSIYKTGFKSTKNDVHLMKLINIGRLLMILS